MKIKKYLPIEYLYNRDNFFQKYLNITKININDNLSTIPERFTLNNYRNFIYNQKEIGLSSLNAFCASYRIMNLIQKKNTLFQPSRLFFYYQENYIEEIINTDSFENIIDGEYYEETLKYKITNYSVITIDSHLLKNIKKSICNKQPVLITISVYSSFESQSVANNGLIPIPNTKVEELLGGHEMCLIGYDDTKQLFTVMNSWGYNWGMGGLCYIPYAYLSNPLFGLQFTIFYL